MRKLIAVVGILIALTACSSIDCPLNNTVYTRYKLTGDITTLADTLTISAAISAGNDSVLINRDVNVDSFSLPISYQRDEDIFFFQLNDTNGVSTIDTVTVAKTNTPHFEAIDCNPSVFHSIKEVRHTRNRIDKIEINHSEVTYDATKTHFYIYFK